MGKQRPKPNLLPAAEWMWSRRGKNIWWTPDTFTDRNPDAAPPKMSYVEATSVFKSLEERGFVFRPMHQGREVHLIHEAKEDEWETFLAESARYPRKTIDVAAFLVEVVCFGVASTGVWVFGEHLRNHGFNMVPGSLLWRRRFTCLGTSAK